MPRRTRAAALTTAFVAVVFMLPPAPAIAEMGVDDYPSELRNAGLGAKVDPWRFYNRYCTSFVAHRINDILGGEPGDWKFTNFTGGGQFSNGRNWDENARNIGWRVDRRPEVGAVYQTETTSNGHVAVVLQVDGDRVKLEEYNLGDGAYHNDRWVNWRSDSTADFIHVPGVREALSSGGSMSATSAASIARTSIAAGPTIADVDGDGADEIGLWDAGTFRWNLDNTGTADLQYWWGRNDDVPFTLDADGDGTADVALRRGNRYVIDTDLDDAVDMAVEFGRRTDTLLVGDFDGDGDDELGVWRDGSWRFNHDMKWAAEVSFTWGRATDQPFVGDFDGDGDTDLGLRRGGRLLLDVNGDRTIDHRIDLGEADDRLLVGDVDGDGTDDLVMWDSGYWRIDLNLRGGPERVRWFGSSSDTPFLADVDGDGTADLGRRNGTRTRFDVDLDGDADRGFRFGTADSKLLGPR